jgi:hypothetical protein
MADIFTHFRAKLKDNPALSNISKPKSQKPIRRTAEETRDFDKWKASTRQVSMLTWLREQLMTYQSTPTKTHDGIDFMTSSSSKGFRLHPALTRFPDAAVVHLFDYLKEQLIAIDYTLATSDSRLFKRDYWDETIQRHVLKSQNALNTEGSPFSEITVELILKDNHLCQLRMNAFVPNTDMPRQTGDFADLMQAILA